MPDDVQKDMIETVLRTYDWRYLDTRRLLKDTLLARVRREFQKSSPTMLIMAKVESLDQSSVADPSKPQRISESILITIGRDKQKHDSGIDLWKWGGMLTRLSTVRPWLDASITKNGLQLLGRHRAQLSR